MGLSQVHALIDSLSRKDQEELDELNGDTSTRQSGLVLTSPQESHAKHTTAGLGDFSQIWQFLGTPLDEPQPSGASKGLQSPTLQQRIPYKIEYTSDGAAYPVPPVKKLQWRDEVSDNPLAEVASDENDEEPTSKLSKKQRKKLNRRRRLLEDLARRAASDLESDAEMPAPSRNPAARASIHSLRSGQVNGTSSKLAESAKSKLYTADGAGSHEKAPQPLPYYDDHEETDGLSESLAEAGRKALARYNSEPPETNSRHASHKGDKKEWPVADPSNAHALAFLPASVGPQKSPKQKALYTSSPAPSQRQTITPKIIRSGPDRHWAFLLKLITDFYEDKASLVAPANLSNHSSDPSGIHVFVDASNIFIGFHDQLTRARQIPVATRVPRVDMSFDALALLLERRRPVAKRVLAGSTPHVPAFDVAKKIGYECAILDKVYKARELTARQRFFAKEDGYSSSEPTHAPQKFVEQGVDEILHLKMLESLVDADGPGTMVLATGDAAQAEYSSGFMVMVERALRRGWTVELVSWSANIAAAYRKDGFRAKWGERFKVVELDDYAEELLDM